MMRKTIGIWIGFILAACAPDPNADAVFTSWRDNQAIDGFDIVSFYSGKPLLGKADLQTEYLGAKWQFSTRANLELFNTNPEAFLPQYGGHCAFAVANGKLAMGTAENWHIRDGKLYLNFNGRVQELWERDIPGNITKGNQYWAERKNP